jgi:MoaA/NifB/PqqE/SkfB family radical SAM enzyme
MINTTFCMAPWTHLYIQPNGNVYPCCSSVNIPNDVNFSDDPFRNFLLDFDSNFSQNVKKDSLGSLNTNTLEEIWNGEEIKEMRINMIKGKPCDYCKTCYKEEELRGYSYRHWFNDSKFEKHKNYVKQTKNDGTLEELNLVYWDFRLTNTCNFKCRMCGPGCSSSWEEEIKKKYNIDKTKKVTNIDVNSIYDQINPLYDIVEQINFAGGEPLISDHHYVILENLLKRGRTDVILDYNTNFSTLVYKGKHIFDIWKKFNNLLIAISLDGIGEKGELIRNGFNWENFLKNVIYFKKTFPHIKLKFNCVVQVLNCFHFMEVQKFLYENKIIDELDDFNISLLYGPEFLSISILDIETKKILVQKIYDQIKNLLIPNNATISISGYKGILKLLKSQNQHLIPKFKSYILALDIMRNENTLKTFPELKRILE